MRALGRPSALLGRFEGRVWALVVIQLITSAGFSISLPFLSLYLHGERGLSMTLVGTIMMVTAFVAAAARLLGGELADRLGRRPVLLLALGARVLLFLGMWGAMATQGPVWVITLVYLGVRLVGGLAHPAISTMVADLTPEGQRTEAYGLLRVGSNVGWAAGPALGGYLATAFPYSTLFLLTALASTISFWLAFGFARESHHATEERPGLSVLGTFRDRRFSPFVGLSLLVLLVGGQLVSTLSVFTVERLGYSEAQFGALLTLNGLLVVALQYPIARTVERVPRGLALALGSVLYGAGYLSLGWLSAFPALMGAIAVVTLGEMTIAPTQLAVVADLAPADRRGQYMGTFGLAEAFGWSAGPFLGGVLLDVFPGSPAAMWGAISSLAFAAAVGFSLWGRS